MINITVDELDSFFKKIIESLKLEQVESVELDTDYYLQISADEWEKFDEFNDGKIEPIVGSLLDDYESIKKEIKDFDDIPFPYNNFDRVASLLHAISQKINPPL